MFCQVNTQSIIKCFLLCIWVTCLRCSATVDGGPRWIDPDDIPNDSLSLNGKKHTKSEDTDDSRNRISRFDVKQHHTSDDTGGFRHEHPSYGGLSPFVQFYIDLGIIIVIMIALYLLWKVLSVAYPQMKFCRSRTETPSLSYCQLTEISTAERNGMNGSCSPPDDSEVIIGFDNPLYANCLQEESADSVAAKDKPPEYETVVKSERNNSTHTSVVRRNPESPPPKYFQDNPLFD